MCSQSFCGEGVQNGCLGWVCFQPDWAAVIQRLDWSWAPAANAAHSQAWQVSAGFEKRPRGLPDALTEWQLCAPEWGIQEKARQEPHLWLLESLCHLGSILLLIVGRSHMGRETPQVEHYWGCPGSQLPWLVNGPLAHLLCPVFREQCGITRAILCT